MKIFFYCIQKVEGDRSIQRQEKLGLRIMTYFWAGTFKIAQVVGIPEAKPTLCLTWYNLIVRNLTWVLMIQATPEMMRHHNDLKQHFKHGKPGDRTFDRQARAFQTQICCSVILSQQIYQILGR